MHLPPSCTRRLLLLVLGGWLAAGCTPTAAPPAPEPALPEVVVPPEADLSGARGVELQVSAGGAALPGFTETVGGGVTADGAGTFEVRCPEGLVLHEGRVGVGLPRTLTVVLPSRHTQLRVVLQVPGGTPRTLDVPVQDGRATAHFE